MTAVWIDGATFHHYATKAEQAEVSQWAETHGKTITDVGFNGEQFMARFLQRDKCGHCADRHASNHITRK